MARNFAEIAFSNAAKRLQEKYGSRNSYSRMEKFSEVNGLTDGELSFIENQNSFYLSSIGSNGFPYIQHRGGPKGFLKVLDSKRVGFIDFTGNKQYVSVGNIATNSKVSLIMVDYPRKSRLKIYAKAEVIQLEEQPELYELLDLDDYKFRPERMLVLHIEAYDWNCPQHITPRYTVDDVETALIPQQKHIAKLEQEIRELKEK
ncbi:MAG: putative pyridoxine 5'-phosphate oxidase superfamily flavin-nucleotide-binding protein [Polaribacter sp.]|jgi:predicted pyridoxine 5'-phosphate oxidase superfamily flavin-nucleotide-binding protein